MSRVRCIDCGRHVHATLGGAWCEVHRPVDLTGGVMAWDHLAPVQSKGRVAMVATQKGQVTAMLLGAGWTQRRELGREQWRDPVTGEWVSRDCASARCRDNTRAGQARGVGPSGRVRVGGDATVATWVELIDRGTPYRVIALEHGVTPRLIHLRVREMRERMRGAA